MRREGRVLGFTCMPLCRFLTATSHSGPRVPAGTRSSPRPLSFEGKATKQSSGETCREDAKACLQLKCELKQRRCLRHTPSLRAQRSNPEMYLGRDSGLLLCARNDDVEAVIRGIYHPTFV